MAMRSNVYQKQLSTNVQFVYAIFIFLQQVSNQATTQKTQNLEKKRNVKALSLYLVEHACTQLCKYVY